MQKGNYVGLCAHAMVISIIDTKTDPGQQSYIYFSKMLMRKPLPLFVITIKGNKQSKNFRMLVQHAITVCDVNNSVTNQYYVV